MKKFTVNKFIIYIILIFWAFTTIYPFFWVISNSFKSSDDILINAFNIPNSLNFLNYSNVFNKTDILISYVNSIIISGSVAILVAIFATASAFVLTRFEFKYKKIIYILLLGGLMIPSFATIIPVFSIVAKLNLVNKRIAVIIPQVAVNLPFAIIVLSSYMKTLPIELEESAYIEGCSIFNIYRKIIVPLSLPAIVSISIFSFLWSYNDLFFQMIILRKKEVMPISALLRNISSDYGTDFGLMCASVTIVIIPILILYIILQKYIIDGMTTGALKG